MTYTTARKVANYSGGGVKESDVHPEWLDWADDLINDYCGRSFGLVPTTYTDEHHDGNGTDTIVLNNIPVISVSSVKIFGVTLSSSAYGVYNWGIKLDNFGDSATVLPYQVYSDDFIGGNFVFPVGTQNILVTYVAGESGVPKAVEMVASMIVSKFALFAREGGAGTSQRWSQAGIQMGDTSIGVIPLSLQSDISSLLKAFLSGKKRLHRKKY